MKPAWKAVACVNVATLLWSGNIVLGRALKEAVGPFTLAGGRAVIASLVFAALLRGSLWKTGRLLTLRQWGLVVLMGLMGVVGFQVLQYAGLRYTTAVNAGIVNALMPVSVFLMARALTGERFSAQQMGGSIASLVGVAILVSRGSWEVMASLAFNRGDFLVLAAVICWGLYSIIGRVLFHSLPLLWVTGVSTMAGALLLLLPLGLECAGNPPTVSAGLGFSLLYIGLGPSCLAFFCWNAGVRRLGPGPASALINTLPLYTAVIAVAFLGESIGASVFVGALFVLAGSLAAALAKPPAALAAGKG